MNRRKAIVHVHPAEPDWSLDLVDGIDAPNVWYGVDTAVAIATLLNNNVATKYPNIRWVFSHAGGGFPALAGRIINLRETPRWRPWRRGGRRPGRRSGRWRP